MSSHFFGINGAPVSQEYPLSQGCCCSVFRRLSALFSASFAFNLLSAPPALPAPDFFNFQHYRTLSKEENLPTTQGFHLSMRRSSPRFYLHPYVSAATARSYAKAAAGGGTSDGFAPKTQDAAPGRCALSLFSLPLVARKYAGQPGLSLP